MPTTEEWEEIGRRLREPFDPREVEFKIQTNPGEGKSNGLVVAFVDARAIQDRLDDVVGAGNWSFDWTPLVTEKGDVQVAKGVLTVHGITKADVGTAGNTEPSKAAVSDALKRTAVQWGISRYLYGLDNFWAALEKHGNYWHIPDGELAKLRSKLPRPSGNAAPRQQQPQQASQPPASAGASSRASPQPDGVPAKPRPDEGGATEQQLSSIDKLCAALGKSAPTEGLTFEQARQLIIDLSADYNRARITGGREPQVSTAKPKYTSTPVPSLAERMRDLGYEGDRYAAEFARVIGHPLGETISVPEHERWKAHIEQLEAAQAAPAARG